jgi:hypothetical protein
MLKQIIKGILKGLVGVDANRDGKISTEEWINFIVSTGTSLLAISGLLF